MRPDWWGYLRGCSRKSENRSVVGEKTPLHWGRFPHRIQSARPMAHRRSILTQFPYRSNLLLQVSALALPWLVGWSAATAGEPAVTQAPVAETRAQQRLAWAEAAEARKGWQVRGLGLGLTLAEAEGQLGAEIAKITPERKPDWRPPAYAPYEEVVQLADGSQFTLTFGSPVSGGIGGVVMYEQTLRNGPTPEALLANLHTKYGPPDERGASGWWLTWHLKSRAPTADGLGAFLKVHFRTEPGGKVEYFRAVLNDYKFMEQDSHEAAEAQRNAAQREYESRKSDQVKF